MHTRVIRDTQGVDMDPISIIEQKKCQINIKEISVYRPALFAERCVCKRVKGSAAREAGGRDGTRLPHTVGMWSVRADRRIRRQDWLLAYMVENEVGRLSNLPWTTETAPFEPTSTSVNRDMNVARIMSHRFATRFNDLLISELHCMCNQLIIRKYT